MKRSLTILAVVVATAAAGSAWYIDNKLPVRDGALPLAGLQAPVQVRYDERGVPHIQARNEADLYRALGFVHAQDRLFQMELLRRLARGELAEILGLSLVVSGVAIVVSMVLGVPAGVFLALRRFPGRRFLVALVNTGMGLPPVVVGLFVFLLLARDGPFGPLELLYTPWAMILAQVVIAGPLVVGITLAAIQGLDEKLRLQILSLGASRLQLYWKLILEARLSMVAALAAGFGSIISEVGAVMMVGGNLKGDTRVMTTAIVLATRQGQFALAIALSVLLLALTLAVNALFTSVQQRKR